MNSIFAGVLGGVGANEVQRKVDKHVHGDPEDGHMFHRLHSTICELLDEIRLIASHFRELQEPPIDQLIVLQTTKTVHLTTRGRRHNMIFVGNNTTQIQAYIPGLGQVAFTPPVGWTALDFEDGTRLSLVTGNDTTVMLRLSNTSLGANAL